MRPINSFESYLRVEPISPINKDKKQPDRKLGESVLRSTNLSKVDKDNRSFSEILKERIENSQKDDNGK